jgi:serine/threonine-protein kinase HipA
MLNVKNWSFIYEDRILPGLSPAYDIVSTICYLPKDQLALKFADTKDMQQIDLPMFEALSLKAGLPSRLVQQVALDAIDATVTVWDQQKKHFNLSKNMVHIIEKHMMGCRLAKFGRSL